MIPPQDPLIEKAIRPLPENEELRLAGAVFLESLRGERSGGEEEMIRRWERVDGSKPVVRGIYVLLAVLAVLTAWVVISDIREVSRFLTGDEWPAESLRPEYAAELRISANLSEAEKVLMFGDLSTTDPVKRKAALWRSEPENPAYFSEYALACIPNEKPLPEDFLSIAKRIDPNNAWFTYLAAAVEAKDSVKVKSRKSSWVGGKRVYSEPISWEIKDRERFERAIAVLREARDQTQFETYSSEMLLKRLALLPQQSIKQQADSAHFLNTNQRAGSTYNLYVGHAIAAKAWFAGNDNDAAQLRQAIDDANQYVSRCLDDEPGALVEEVVYRTSFAKLSESLAVACLRLNFTDEAAKWQQIEQGLYGRKQTRNNPTVIVDGVSSPLGVKTIGIRGNDGFVAVANWDEAEPFLTDTDVAPGRNQDHEFLSRYCCYLAWGILAIVTSGVALYRFRTPKMVRLLAGRMGSQLLLVDWVWMFGLGVLLPFLWVMAINRFTPWGGREFGILGGLLMLPAAQFLGLVVLWLIVPVQVARWRLGKRLGIFGYGNWNTWAIWIAMVAGFAFIPIIGWAATHGTIPELWVDRFEFPEITIAGRAVWESPLWIAVGVLGIPLAWLLWGMSAGFLSNSIQLLYRASVARALVPIYLSAMLLILAAVPLFKFAEEYWFQRNALSRFDPSLPSWSRYEYLVAVQARKELRAVMGYDD